MNTRKITIGPYKSIELARLYRVNRLTLKKWLRPFQNEIGIRIGHYFSAIQVKIIFEKLGQPDDEDRVVCLTTSL